VRLEGLGQLKNPMTSSGIEPATFRLVAYCLNQLRYCVPRDGEECVIIQFYGSHCGLGLLFGDALYQSLEFNDLEDIRYLNRVQTVTNNPSFHNNLSWNV
jgi:hypothetical protein